MTTARPAQKREKVSPGPLLIGRLAVVTGLGMRVAQRYPRLNS